MKVSVIEPGMVETELLSHNTHPMVLEAAKKFREQVGEPLVSEDIAEAILYAVGGPERVAVNEVLVRPRGQRSGETHEGGHLPGAGRGARRRTARAGAAAPDDAIVQVEATGRGPTSTSTTAG